MKYFTLLILALSVVSCDRTHGTLETVDASMDPVVIPKAEFDKIVAENRELERLLDECENPPKTEFFCPKKGKCPKGKK